MDQKKSILFLSPFDFVDKGIQVIIKTPTYYAEHGWKVNFVVLRDESIKGSYYYQQPINPPGVSVTRKKMFSIDFFEKSVVAQLPLLIYAKIRSYIVIFQLVYEALKVLRHNKDISIVYGYGPVGTLAAFITQMIHPTRKLKVVSRFFGISNTDELIASLFKRLLNWDVILSLYLKAEVCIITNDGTQGDLVLKAIGSRSISQLQFLVNGVDEWKSVSSFDCEELKARYKIEKNEKVFLSLSRLVSWKRVDRSLNVIAKIVHDLKYTQFKFLVVGDGSDLEHLKKLVTQLKIENFVIFTGAIPNNQVKTFLQIADIFVSTYDLSNVGNPLLEAIRAHKVIFTLNNGDTSSWIQHLENGFIYDIDREQNFIQLMAQDIVKTVTDETLRSQIINGVTRTEKEKLYTWEERLNKELQVIENL